MSKELDEFKKRLKIEKMEDKERKELFNKFIEKGGQVVDESKKSSFVIVNKEKQKEYLKYIEEHKKILEKKLSEKSSTQQAAQKQSNYSDKQNYGLILRFRGAIAGVIGLTNGYIKETIYELVKNVLQDCYINLSYVGASILHPKIGGIEKVKRELMKRSPFSYEFLVRMESFYDEDDFNTILRPYENDREAKIKPQKFKDSIRRIFRNLFLFYTYENAIIEAVTDGLELNSKTQNLSRSFIEEMLIRTKSSLKIMYSQKFFNKMFLLYCLSCGENLHLSSNKGVLISLGISEDEIGSIAEKTKEELESFYKRKFGSKIVENLEGEESENVQNESIEGKESEKEKKEQEETNEIPEEYVEGKKIFDGLNFIIPERNSNNRKKFFKPNDKMLYTIIAYEYFDKEFSFLMTSNKISYSVDFVDGKKLDLRGRLNELYTIMGTCRDMMEEYYKIIEQINKIEQDNTTAITQKYSFMHKHQISQTKISYDVRKKLLETFLELIKLFEYSKNYGMILNVDEALFFDKIDGKRYLEGKTTKDAITLCLSYIKFLIFNLEKGFLSGSSPTIQKY